MCYVHKHLYKTYREGQADRQIQRGGGGADKQTNREMMMMMMMMMMMIDRRISCR